MPEKVGFWERLHRSKKMRVVFFCVSMAVIIGIYVSVIGIVRELGLENILSNLEKKNDCTILIEFTEPTEASDNLAISGWTKRYESNLSNVVFVLKEVGTNTEYATLANVKNIDNKSYFTALVKKQKISMDVCYELFLALSYSVDSIDEDGNPCIVTEQKKIELNKYLYNGELYNYNPQIFSEPLFNSPTMQNVISNGDICFYSAENGIWIYQYQGFLYWITSSNFRFDTNKKTTIPFHTYTLEKDKLPERMREDGFDNFDFIFEEYEVDMNEEQYRIAKRKIPTEYFITWIVTGAYNRESREWYWQAYMPIMKSFEEE